MPAIALNCDAHGLNLMSPRSTGETQLLIERTGDSTPVITATTAKLTYTISKGLDPLKSGPRLEAFEALFSEDELKLAKKQVAEENVQASGSATLADLRMAAGYSQVELAKKIGKTQTNLSFYERGKTDPSLSVAKQLSKELGVTLDEVFDAIEEAKA